MSLVDQPLRGADVFVRSEQPGSARGHHGPPCSFDAFLEALISAMGLGLAVRPSRLADASLLPGRADEAAERARSAVDLARTHNERTNEAMALRALAAEQHDQSSLALARQIGMRPLIAHGHAGLGSLYARAGDRQRAAEQAAVATTMYRELGMNG